MHENTPKWIVWAIAVLLVTGACTPSLRVDSSLVTPALISVRLVESEPASPLATPVSPIATAIAYTDPTPTPLPVSDLDTTKWTLTSLRDQAVENLGIKLEFYNRIDVTGKMICNFYGRYYTVSDGQFSVTQDRGTTRFRCDSPPEALEIEASYLEALGSVKYYDRVDNQLILKDADRQPILIFALQMPPILDSRLTGPGWDLQTIYGQGLVADTRITLGFSLTTYEGHVGGYAGCNSYGGQFLEASEGRFKIGETAMTAMGCGPAATMEQESLYLETLGEVVAYHVTDEQLVMTDVTGTAVLVFDKKPEFSTNPADLIGTEWQLASVNGQAASGQTLAFQSEHVITGITGCRDYYANYFAEGDDIAFTRVGMATSECPNSETDEGQGLQTPLVGPSLIGDIWLQEEDLTFFAENGAIVNYVRFPDVDDHPLIGTNWHLVGLMLKRQDQNVFMSDLHRAVGFTANFTADTISGDTFNKPYVLWYQQDDGQLLVEQVDAESLFGADADYTQRMFTDYMTNARAYRILGEQLWIEIDAERGMLFRAGE